MMSPHRVKRESLIWFYILVLTIFSILINGYFFESGFFGHILYDIPIINIYNDNSLYPNDLLKAVAPYYYTLSNPLASLLIKYVDIQIFFFIIFLISAYFTFLLIFYISKLLFKKNITALLSVLLFLVMKAALGQSTLFPSFSERVIALPLILFSIYLFLKNNYYLSMIVNSFAFLVHSISATHLFILYCLYFAINYKKIGLLKIPKYIFTFLIFSSPLIIWKFLTPVDTPIFKIPDLWLRILHVYQYWHLFPSQWHIGKWLAFLAFLLVFIIAFRYKPLNINHHRKIVTFLLGILILAIIGTIFTEIYPTAIIVNLQLFRATLFLFIFGAIYLSNYLVNLLKHKNLGLRIASAGMLGSLFIGNFKGVYIFLALILSLKLNSIIKIPLILLSIFGSVLGVVGTFYPGLPIISLFKIGTLPLIIITLSCLFAWTVISFKSLKKYRRSLIEIFILFVLALSSFYVIGLRNIIYEHEGIIDGVYIGQPVGELTFVGFIRNPYDPLSFKGISTFLNQPLKIINKNVQFPLDMPSSEFEEVQIWAKENTKKGAIFITPPYLKGFRLFSQRSTIADCNDLGVSNPVCTHGYITIKRLESLCDTKFTNRDICSPENCMPKYNNLPEEKLLEISKKYKASYVVVEKPWGKNLELVFENNKFRVYKVNDFDVEDTAPLIGRYPSLARLEGINGCV